MTTLKDLYYNPQTGFSGINKLYERARRDGMQVKKKDVINFLNGEEGKKVLIWLISLRISVGGLNSCR